MRFCWLFVYCKLGKSQKNIEKAGFYQEKAVKAGF